MADSSMSWDKLLSKRRQGRANGEEPTVGRSNFQRDYDRIVYSSAFRRLQDKAQVFPLAKSDFVRTRLTHSLEVSCVGRSLGTEIGLRLGDRLPKGIHSGDVGNIVTAACLAHDIGNPPFGHAGEAAIQEWFRETEPCLEIQRTDGVIFIQITLNEGRTVELKKAFYKTVAERLNKELGIRMEDVFIGLIEVKKENWSFGNGIAQYAQ